MQLEHHCAGVSLLELLISVVMITTVVMTLSIALPKVSISSLQSRQRTMANNLANSQIQTLKSQPFDLVDASGVNSSNACDCTTLTDFSVLPKTSTSIAGTTFIAAACINFVVPGGTPNSWSAQCADSRYKRVVVNVSWTNGPNTHFISQESFMMRS